MIEGLLQNVQDLSQHAFKETAENLGSANNGAGIAYGLVAVGAGLAMTGAIGTGAGQGIAGGRAADAVGRNPEAEAKIRSMMIIGSAIAESAAIYALVISILLIFVY